MELKQEVLKKLKTLGYHDDQLRQLNPIIENTINATLEFINYMEK